MKEILLVFIAVGIRLPNHLNRNEPLLRHQIDDLLTKFVMETHSLDTTAQGARISEDDLTRGKLLDGNVDVFRRTDRSHDEKYAERYKVR